MNVLVTGAAGFIGHRLCTLLRSNPNVQVIETDIADCDLTVLGDVHGLLFRSNPEVIYHLAGLIRADAPAMYAANVLGTVNLLEAARTRSGLARIVVVGSAAEYGPGHGPHPIHESEECRPVGHYAVSKHAATLAALDFASRGLDVVVARPFNLLGVGMKDGSAGGAMLARVMEARASGAAEIRVGDMELARDFVSVNDMADALVAIAAHGKTGSVYNVASGAALRLRDILNHLLARVAHDVSVERDPALYRATDAPVVCGSYDKIRRDCGWEPTTPWWAAVDAAWNSVVEACK